MLLWRNILILETKFFLRCPSDVYFSALFPALIGKVTAPPAPPVVKRSVMMPNLNSFSAPVVGFQPMEVFSKLINDFSKKLPV